MAQDDYQMTEQELRKGQRVRVLKPESLAGLEGFVLRGCVASDFFPGRTFLVQLDADRPDSEGRMFRDDALVEI